MAILDDYYGHETGRPGLIAIELEEGDDFERAVRILRAAVLVINDRVTELYHDQEAPERVSALEAGNYIKNRR